MVIQFGLYFYEKQLILFYLLLLYAKILHIANDNYKKIFEIRIQY